MDTPPQAPPVIPKAAPVSTHLELTVPVQTFLAWCTWFTVGVVLLGTTIPMLRPFGFAFILLGVFPYFSHRFLFKCTPFFIVLLGLSLLAVLEGFVLGEGWPTSKPKPPQWFFILTTIVWAAGIAFSYWRWRTTMVKRKENA